MSKITISERPIGKGFPMYIIAEISANHHNSLDRALKIVQAAASAGADAVKLQAYTASTLTIDCDREEFLLPRDTIWAGKTLYNLYSEAQIPWEWIPIIKKEAENLGMHCFASSFDAISVDFLENCGVPAHKIASFELVDIPLIRKAAATGKPLILSTGMASESEIDAAVCAARDAGCEELALLKCTSAYPAPVEEMNLSSLPRLSSRFNCPVGLSDHTLCNTAAIIAVALGACIVEKHLTLSRADPGPDSSFSLEPKEFRAFVQAVRMAEKAMGTGEIKPSSSEMGLRAYRRSLFAVRDIFEGQIISSDDIRSIRPGHGLPPSDFEKVIGKRAINFIPRGAPLRWADLSE